MVENESDISLISEGISQRNKDIAIIYENEGTELYKGKWVAVMGEEVVGVAHSGEEILADIAQKALDMRRVTLRNLSDSFPQNVSIYETKQ